MPKHKKKKPSQASEATAAEQPAEPQVQPSAGSSGDGGGKGKGKKGGQQKVIAEPPPPPSKKGPKGKGGAAAESPAAESTPPPEEPEQPSVPEMGGSGDAGGKGKGKKGKGRAEVPPEERAPPAAGVPEPAPPAGRQKGPSPPGMGRGGPPPGAGRGGPPPGVGRGGPPPGMGRGGPPPGFAAATRAQTPSSEGTPPPESVPTGQRAAPKGPSPPSDQRGTPPGMGPGGPPQGYPQGPPQGRAGGPPQGHPQGPPQGRPGGPPQGAAPPEARPPAEEPMRTYRDPSALRQIETITEKMASLKLPTRADINRAGTLGRRTVVETNHLKLDLSQLRNKIAFHYDVTIDPDRPKRLFRLVIEEFRLKHYRNRFPAFDGRKNLVSAGSLPFGESIADTVSVNDEESKKPKEFKVTIRFVSRVDLTTLTHYMNVGSSLDVPQTAIQMIDIVLRNAPAMRFVPVGRSYFTPPTGRIVTLGDGMEMWYGLFQSANLGWQPFVNVDVVHKGFPIHQPVIDVIKELCCDYHGNIDLNKQLSDYQQRDLEQFIRKLKVDYMLPDQPATKRTYRVNHVASSAARLTFSLANGQQTSVKDYFLKEKRINLQYPNMPCLHVGSLQRENPIYLPVEFCKVTFGQAVNRTMNEKQTSNMIKAAATSTEVRKSKIMDALKRVKFNEHPAVQEFGLRVSESFARVPAHILPPPELAYKEARPIVPRSGVWRASKFLEGQKLTNWTVLNLDDRTREDSIWSTVSSLQKAGEALGMQISQPNPVVKLKPLERTRNPADLNRAKEAVKEFFQANKDKQLIVVIVPDKGDSYARVKQLAELNVGVLTQCLKAKTVFRMNPATASNILLKVNSKLNGVNHKLAPSVRPKCLETPAMLVGADVTHPSPQATDIPSVAAVCASHDPNGFRYNFQFRLQPPREEIILDLETIMKHHLLFFYQRTRHKPQRILFFRDGVSEGQFQQVMQAEIPAIRRACKSLEHKYEPAITFLVVQKRHHTRFFPTCDQDRDGKNANVPAGTIVDTEITHPTEIDFYLVSHASIQGVSRPTKYHCLCDDSKMSDNDLQQLTYFLCHMFSRCTRSVSYPAPTYYAHLAAYRARVHIEGRNIQLNNLAHEQNLSRIQEELTKNSPMFFV